ncbi:hypothetical protein ACIQX3_21420 [Peribacillus frigoritolerans]|uniref:hypothetical protein n=1 Tax=Peribacillus frigoritolerans TaxID=450367 RepID=UPI003808C760
MAFDLTARLSLVDKMTKPLRSISKQMESFRKTTNGTRDANGRLRDEQGRFVSSGSRVSKSFSSMTSSSRNYTASLAGVAAGIGAVIGVQKTLNATVGAAMKMEQSQIVIEAMIDDKSLSTQYMKMIDKFAIDSPVLDTQAMYSNSKSFLAASTDLKELEKMWDLSERLVAVDPVQGVEGAVLALRELFSGDTQSLVERFELPRGALNDIKNLPLKEQLAELDKLFNKMNMTKDLVKEMGNASLGIINRIKEALQVKLRDMGFQALASLKPMLEDLDKAVSAGNLDGFFNAMSQAFAFLGAEAAKFGEYIKTNWPTIQTNFTTTKDALAPLGDAVSKIYDGAKKVGDYMIQNWSTVTETVIALAGGLVVLKAGLAGMAIVTTITKAMNAYKLANVGATTAAALFNATLYANPIGLVIAAIAALTAAAIYLYRNWDTVKSKTIELWNKMGNLKFAILALLGPFGSIVSAGVAIWKNFDTIASKAGTMVNTVISKVNSMIGVLNKIPGVNIPIVSKVSWGNVTSAPQYSKSTGQGRQISAAGGLSYVPRDGTIINAHRGERVLTKQENKEYTSGKGGGNTYNFGGIHLHGTGSTEKDADKLFDLFVKKVEAAGGAGA